MTIVTIFGGYGFLGRRVVQRLVAERVDVRVAVRQPDRARAALGQVSLDWVTVVGADVRDQHTVEAAIAGSDSVVNAVSAYLEKGAVTFAAIHEEGAETVAREAARAGVARLVHVSGIGADADSRYPYIRSRGRGERLVKEAFASATIVRPGVMFGPGDALFAGTADLARWLPALPLIGGGQTRLQPVHVGDVAEAVARILTEPATAGQTYELAGPRAYTLRELVTLALETSGRRRLLVPLPFALARLQAQLLELLPSPPLSTAQVDLLRADNVASGTYPGFEALGIAPRSVEGAVPTYLSLQRQGGWE